MRSPRRARLTVSAAMVLGSALLAGCTAGAAADPVAAPTVTAADASGATGAAADWPTYHHDNGRTGVAAGLAPLGTLRPAWHAKLDGAVYGQPLIVGDAVLAATENDTVYALDANTGAVRWSRHVGTPVPSSVLPCGDIDPLGITGTMAYDQATGRVYAVAETTGGAHTLYGLAAASGAVAVRVGVEPPAGDRLAHQQRAALTVLAGRVYVAYGGLAGDCANYVGSVVSVTTAGTQPLRFAVPTTREGGIWTPGGAVVADGALLYAVGNGESTTGYDGSDSVTALSPALSRTDLFAPANWADDNATDLDLASASPTVLGDWVFITGKRGTGYVLHRGHLGGVGGQAGQGPVCRSFGGSSVSGDVAYLPCTDGTRALAIGADGTPTVRWRAAVGAGGPPVVGGGAVWTVDTQAGVLYALDPGSGAVRARLSIGTVPHFASPSLAGGRAYVGLLDGVTAIDGA